MSEIHRRLPHSASGTESVLRLVVVPNAVYPHACRLLIARLRDKLFRRREKTTNEKILAQCLRYRSRFSCEDANR